ncbi:MAG: hypothetical protein AB7S55_01295 [Thiomonas sp.]
MRTDSVPFGMDLVRARHILRRNSRQHTLKAIELPLARCLLLIRRGSMAIRQPYRSAHRSAGRQRSLRVLHFGEPKAFLFLFL